MSKIIARLFSFIFHPLLVPVYFLLILYQLKLPEVMLVPDKYKVLMLAFVFSTTFLMPVLFALLLWAMKIIKNLYVHGREERTIPMIGVAVFYFITFYALKRMPVFPVFKLFMLGSTVLVLLGIVINYFYKISLHLMAWGGFVAALTGMSFQFHQTFYFWLFLVVFSSGLVGFARIQCRAHNHTQINLGFLLGFVVMLGLFLFL